MKATYIIALSAVLAASVNATPLPGDKEHTQVQQANGNNAEYTSKGNSLIDLSNLLGGGVNIGSDSSKTTNIKQDQHQ